MRRWGPWSLCDSGSSRAGHSGRHWDSAVCTPLTKSFVCFRAEWKKKDFIDKVIIRYMKKMFSMWRFTMNLPVWHWSPSQPVGHWHVFGPKHSPPFLHFCRHTAAAKEPKYIRMWWPAKQKPENVTMSSCPAIWDLSWKLTPPTVD